MDHRIIGTTMPALEIRLQPGETLFAESGELAWMSMAIQLRTGTSVSGQPSGLKSVLGRVVAGATVFMTEYTAVGAVGMVAFCARLPGEIRPLEITPERGYLVHRHGFMCATAGVRLGVGYQQRLGAGIFGGAGFRMQRLSGQGQAFVELHGAIVEYTLPAGNMLRVHPGHVAMFEESVDFNVTAMPGIRNALFGGDGLFLAALTGPGRVWLQSMSLPHLAQGLTHYLHEAGEGSLLGSLVKGS